MISLGEGGGDCPSSGNPKNESVEDEIDMIVLVKGRSRCDENVKTEKARSSSQKRL